MIRSKSRAFGSAHAPKNGTESQIDQISEVFQNPLFPAGLGT
ncbi:hypothetical protein Z948_511 [Sulfitobacter donghicola DSW-25 = KCTC 12864 = JCM 14565]|uniref:Uncharacterized protein n=1 Tax=Sulfitobacter donghicola DSW-25 = KCTC 12864 = JCM 14565 TaxID=1300350 RepID=A0A073IJ17_9RHOB|nr:hypothetical protein DSW25_07535 [Sulfitobacter donghicola DSW-25 = KCTC 12864 = JCM 14565]KIN66807.1 hypothetical protein Z948_511 [Sulfitobacter donghicola DSW-25 = KCTC 12864 = JCM 14565]